MNRRKKCPVLTQKKKKTKNNNQLSNKKCKPDAVRDD